jgi:hypothetical protein
MLLAPGGADDPWRLIVLPMTFYAAALGMVLPHAMAMALEHFPHIAATTSSLFGFLQMGLSAVITAWRRRRIEYITAADDIHDAGCTS